MEFSRPEYWSGEPLPSLEDFPNPGIEPRSLALQLDFLPAETTGSLDILIKGQYPKCIKNSYNSRAKKMGRKV